jgi:hypothetical protein
MTAPTVTTPPITTLPVTTPLVKPAPELTPLVVLVTNEKDNPVTIEGVFSSSVVLPGQSGPARSAPVPKTIPKKSKDLMVTFNPITGKSYDRLEVTVKPSIIHTITAPKTGPQKVTIK